VEQADEVQLIIKTGDSNWSRLEQFIQQEHPYEVPELIAVPISAGLPAYLTWLESACVSRD
jgi:periplasmic divalent cation tolerance protein